MRSLTEPAAPCQQVLRNHLQGAMSRPRGQDLGLWGSDGASEGVPVDRTAGLGVTDPPSCCVLSHVSSHSALFLEPDKGTQAALGHQPPRRPPDPQTWAMTVSSTPAVLDASFCAGRGCQVDALQALRLRQTAQHRAALGGLGPMGAGQAGVSLGRPAPAWVPIPTAPHVPEGLQTSPVFTLSNDMGPQGRLTGWMTEYRLGVTLTGARVAVVTAVCGVGWTRGPPAGRGRPGTGPQQGEEAPWDPLGAQV